MGVLPVGRLKKRLLAACRNRFVCGFESLLCPFFHRLSFDPVPDRSFPDLTIFRGRKLSRLAKLYVCVEQPAPDACVAQQMTSRMFSRARAWLYVIYPADDAIQHNKTRVNRKQRFKISNIVCFLFCQLVSKVLF